MTVTPIDWDAWRREYAEGMSVAELRDFYSRVWELHRDQRCHSKNTCAVAIAEIRPRWVLELGGWDGELGKSMLDAYPEIRRWTSVEICPEAVRATRAREDPRLSVICPGDWWFWERRWECDLFVASHVIEHMTAEELGRTFCAVEAYAMYLEAPLEEHGRSWTGYAGSHILEEGWDWVDTCLGHLGHELMWDVPVAGHARLYRR
jgi:hypothetical protein